MTYRRAHQVGILCPLTGPSACGCRKLGHVADLRLRGSSLSNRIGHTHRRAELHSTPTRQRGVDHGPRAESSALTPTQDRSPSAERP
jgi:hypothetical protein